MGTTFKVNYLNKYYVLEKAPHYIYDSDQEHFNDEYRLWTNEMNVSYDLEDKGMFHIRQVHHMFIKRMYNSRKQCFYYCFWTLKEYFEGESIMWFDYGACVGKHKPGRLLLISTVKKFVHELLTVYLQLLKFGYFPYRFNDDGIIMRLKGDIIEWKFVQYHYFEKNKSLNTDDLRQVVMNFRGMCCWKLCGYSNYSTHKLADKYERHPFWDGLSSLMDARYEYYDKLQSEAYSKGQCKGHGDWPPSTITELISDIQSFLDYLDL